MPLRNCCYHFWASRERFDDPQKQHEVRDKVWPGDIDAAFAYRHKTSAYNVRPALDAVLKRHVG